MGVVSRQGCINPHYNDIQLGTSSKFMPIFNRTKTANLPTTTLLHRGYRRLEQMATATLLFVPRLFLLTLLLTSLLTFLPTFPFTSIAIADQGPSRFRTFTPLDAIQEEVRESPDHSTILNSVKETDEKKPSLSIHSLCIKIGAKLGSVSEKDCLELDFQYSGGESVQKQPILVKEFGPMPHKNPNRGMRTPQARVLLMGGIHGDEYSSVSIVFKWLKILTKHHSGLFHWRISPLINPDGLLQKTASRVNANGVDLNRNFPSRDWRNTSTDYWVRRTGRDPRRYPGKKPLSEPESRWVYQEINQFKPNVIIAIHAPYGLLDFDGPPSIPPERLGNIYLSLLGTYPGSLGRYAGENLKIPIITIELPHAGILPTDEHGRRIWMDLVHWLRIHAHDRKKTTRQASAIEAPYP